MFTFESGRPEILEQGNVPVFAPRTHQDVTPLIAEHTRFTIGIVLRQIRLLKLGGVKPGGREIEEEK
jgi:hypothetical protein